MKKHFVCILMLLCALLCGCGGRDDTSQSTLRIAAAFRSEELDALAAQFEALHGDCTVVVDYYPDNAYDRLCTEIMAGDGPDVLNLYGLSLPLDSPYLEDLYGYIDADEELHREDFVPAVLSSLEVGGVLRSLPATYEVVTLSARTSDVGTGTSWTFEEMCDALTQRPQCRLLPEYWVQTEFLRWIAAISIGQFIDWEHHTANYSSAAFQKQLQFCALLPEIAARPANRDPESCLTHFDVVQNGAGLQQLSNLWGEPFTFIGFPTESGSGSFFECTTLHLGISANSQKKSLAWEFVKLAVSQETQQQLSRRMYMPVRRDAMEAQVKAAGSDEAVQRQYFQLVSQPLVFIGYNADVAEIILEEGTACFDGKRTVEEAAERIQNRVTLYLSEIE